MARYTVWYSETYTYKAWFEADSKEHAQELLEQVRDSEIEVEELPEFGNKDKNYELDVAVETLEEVEN